MTASILRKPLALMCALLGHKWRYKDYSNILTDEGKKHEFTSVRKCFRCSKRQYFFSDWMDHKHIEKS